MGGLADKDPSEMCRYEGIDRLRSVVFTYRMDHLGTIEREKVRVKASQVFENMTVCKTYRTHWIGSYDLSPLEQTVAAFMPRTRVTDTLRADKNDLPRELTLEESIVKIGDPVIRVTDTDPDD